MKKAIGYAVIGLTGIAGLFGINRILQEESEALEKRRAASLEAGDVFETGAIARRNANISIEDTRGQFMSEFNNGKGLNAKSMSEASNQKKIDRDKNHTSSKAGHILSSGRKGPR